MMKKPFVSEDITHPPSYLIYMSEYTMNVPAKRELTDKQKTFLDNLLINGGNITQAVKEAGYHPGSRGGLVRSLKQEIIDHTRNHLIGSSVKAANRISEALDADGSIPSSQMDTRLKAANDILDRVGVSKRQEVEHTGEVMHGIVLLPAKQPMKEITVEG